MLYQHAPTTATCKEQLSYIYANQMLGSRTLYLAGAVVSGKFERMGSQWGNSTSPNKVNNIPIASASLDYKVKWKD